MSPAGKRLIQPGKLYPRNISFLILFDTVNIITWSLQVKRKKGTLFLFVCAFYACLEMHICYSMLKHVLFNPYSADIDI